ncbi:protein PET117 homolog, mitochondrial [Dermatophagoides pteronyssinus]|uniref:Uncharacterized protein n=1 Tax=Dermatophagoides pteronyssinus TaxID=6956 RepID=A0ABQ8ISP9_DERPT|nr:hypothetical protein DERP_007824 [Dermatophagoides pteronyssinus]
MTSKTLAKWFLAISIIGSIALIWNVHQQQILDRQRLHDGVIRDQERQRYKQMLRDLSSTNRSPPPSN